MVGSAKSEQQKLPQQYLPNIPFVLGTTESALNSSLATTQQQQQQQPLQLQSQSTLQQPKELATAKW